MEITKPVAVAGPRFVTVTENTRFEPASPLVGPDSTTAKSAIGEMVMEALRTLDDVAYVRFASVYRNFREAKDFETLLDELSGEEEKAGGAGRK